MIILRLTGACNLHVTFAIVFFVYIFLQMVQKNSSCGFTVMIDRGRTLNLGYPSYIGILLRILTNDALWLGNSRPWIILEFSSFAM